MTDAVAKGLAVLAIMVQVLLAVVVVLALASLVSPRARRALVEVRETLLGGELWAAWAVALTATLGSLYFSEIAHFEPCRLCWFQRIFMYPLAILLLGMAIRRDRRNALLYALPLPVIGLAWSVYHVYIEYHPEAESQSCRRGIPCSTKWIEELGYVTIPVLAGTAFAAIIVLLAMAHSRSRAPAPPPAAGP
jgi:disulfide bond formation protein DsbB